MAKQANDYSTANRSHPLSTEQKKKAKKKKKHSSFQKWFEMELISL
jgi:hypothetical protein